MAWGLTRRGVLGLGLGATALTLGAARAQVMAERAVGDWTVSTLSDGHLRIGSVPARRLQAVKVGVPRTFSCALGTIEHLSIAPRLFFGFAEEKGIRLATPEKAWLDACYYAYKGRTFSFDLDTDVDRTGLDEVLLSKYLAAYDPRFRAIYERTWRKP